MTRFERQRREAAKFRERVHQLLAKGLRQAEIARRLQVSRQRIHQIVTE